MNGVEFVTLLLGILVGTSFIPLLFFISRVEPMFNEPYKAIISTICFGWLLVSIELSVYALICCKAMSQDIFYYLSIFVTGLLSGFVFSLFFIICYRHTSERRRVVLMLKISKLSKRQQFDKISILQERLDSISLHKPNAKLDRVLACRTCTQDCKMCGFGG